MEGQREREEKRLKVEEKCRLRRQLKPCPLHGLGILHLSPPPPLDHVVAVFFTPAEGPLAPPYLNPILDLSRHFLLLNE